MKLFSIILFIILVFSLHSISLAEDPEGSSDHDLISRFPGSRIVYYDQVEYDEYKLGLSRWNDAKKEFEESKILKGKLTRILYYIPLEHTPVEIYKNYESALKKADFDILFSGKGEELGKFGEAMLRDINFNRGITSTRRGTFGYHVSGASDQHFISGRKNIDGRNVYISVFIGGASRRRQDPFAIVNIIEEFDTVFDSISIEKKLREDTERLTLDIEDPEGSRDHPIISRFPEAKIAFYTELEYEEYELGLGKYDHREEEFSESLFLEGGLTQILYQIPRDRTPIEIYKNYEQGLKRADFEILFSGRGEELGRYGHAMYNDTYVQSGELSIRPGNVKISIERASDQHYLAAKTAIGGQDIYIALFIGGASSHSNSPLALLTVIECEAMEDDLIYAKDILEQIRMTGRAVVYGIYFDINSYEIKPESEKMLNEIAKALKENADLNIYIVGHTDDTGDFTHNMDLSLSRAESVKTWLESNYNIPGENMKAIGVGPASPQSTNRTEYGRSANRRVELVERLKN